MRSPRCFSPLEPLHAPASRASRAHRARPDPRHPRRLAGIVAVLACLLQPALAEPVSRTLAASCSGCHGTHGQGAAAMPALAGLPSERLAGLLRAFRDGQRPASVMHQLIKGYSDAEIGRLAEHFSRLPQPAR